MNEFNFCKREREDDGVLYVYACAYYHGRLAVNKLSIR